jgi:hypothetical protein
MVDRQGTRRNRHLVVIGLLGQDVSIQENKLFLNDSYNSYICSKQYSPIFECKVYNMKVTFFICKQTMITFALDKLNF